MQKKFSPISDYFFQDTQTWSATPKVATECGNTEWVLLDNRVENQATWIEIYDALENKASKSTFGSLLKPVFDFDQLIPHMVIPAKISGAHKPNFLGIISEGILKQVESAVPVSELCNEQRMFAEMSMQNDLLKEALG